MYYLGDKPFVNGYIDCAVWLAEGNENQSVDARDLPEDILHDLANDAIDFFNSNDLDLERCVEKGGYSYERGGHDFWLTRNRHGAGFWDSHYPALDGNKDMTELIRYAFDRLTRNSHPYGESFLDVSNEPYVLFN